MNKTGFTLWLGIVLGVLVNAPAQSQQDAMPKGHPAVDQAASGTGSAHPPSARSVTGTVIETMNASNYTYVQVDAGSRTIWAAAPQFSVKVGDRVSVPTASPMQNYRSDSLGRTFPLVYFAGKITLAGAGLAADRGAPQDRTTPHPSQARATRASELSFEGITKPDGGHTIGEFFDAGKGLAGSEVAIRGRVVKYSPGIMGTNWVHLQDGTEGRDGRNDLVITSDDAVSFGDLVVVRGVVTADRNFGSGYVYDLIVEGAKLEVDGD